MYSCVIHLFSFFHRSSSRKCHVCQPEMSLYEAIRDNNSKKVKSILAKNSELVHSSRRYGSPLLIAAEGGFTDIIKVLLKHGADLNAVDSNGWSPLISACHFNHNEAVNVLLECGADPNLKCQLGNTSMHAAALNNNVKNMKALKDHGACVNSVNVDGWAPIHRATYSNRTNAVKFLLDECGADVMLRSHSGKTPHEIALQMRLDELAHLIRKYESKRPAGTTTVMSQQQRPLPPTRNEPQGQPEGGNHIDRSSNDSNRNINDSLTTATPGPSLQSRLTEFKDFAIRLFSANKDRGASTSQQQGGPVPQRRPTPGDDSDDDDEESKDECPICFEIPLPPMHIYQCTNGHIYCGKCKDSPNMEKCPQCGIDISHLDNRNRYAEEHIAQIYKNNKAVQR